ncbi:hypothetical protein BESB_056990 [Besnoitia besnoiti]|uniref:Uncharacterized protein n=1 Tax=Besnoitia besnoiti TaxID=94643 RepID=A0A2A9MC33_BESBE|nr:hypothetical protein BESB_056990 [Besnoitia besnoiti]PFH36048.1 hypothetical protein BESB_056990 [Besnoitia besnoiti]
MRRSSSGWRDASGARENRLCRDSGLAPPSLAELLLPTKAERKTVSHVEEGRAAKVSTGHGENDEAGHRCKRQGSEGWEEGRKQKKELKKPRKTAHLRAFPSPLRPARSEQAMPTEADGYNLSGSELSRVGTVRLHRGVNGTTGDEQAVGCWRPRAEGSALALKRPLTTASLFSCSPCFVGEASDAARWPPAGAGLRTDPLAGAPPQGEPRRSACIERPRSASTESLRARVPDAAKSRRSFAEEPPGAREAELSQDAPPYRGEPQAQGQATRGWSIKTEAHARAPRDGLSALGEEVRGVLRRCCAAPIDSLILATGRPKPEARETVRPTGTHSQTWRLAQASEDVASGRALTSVGERVHSAKKTRPLLSAAGQGNAMDSRRTAKEEQGTKRERRGLPASATALARARCAAELPARHPPPEAPLRFSAADSPAHAVGPCPFKGQLSFPLRGALLRGHDASLSPRAGLERNSRGQNSSWVAADARREKECEPQPGDWRLDAACADKREQTPLEKRPNSTRNSHSGDKESASDDACRPSPRLQSSSFCIRPAIGKPSQRQLCAREPRPKPLKIIDGLVVKTCSSTLRFKNVGGLKPPGPGATQVEVSSSTIERAGTPETDSLLRRGQPEVQELSRAETEKVNAGTMVGKRLLSSARVVSNAEKESWRFEDLLLRLTTRSPRRGLRQIQKEVLDYRRSKAGQRERLASDENRARGEHGDPPGAQGDKVVSTDIQHLFRFGRAQDLPQVPAPVSSRREGRATLEKAARMRDTSGEAEWRAQSCPPASILPVQSTTRRGMVEEHAHVVTETGHADMRDECAALVAESLTTRHTSPGRRRMNACSVCSSHETAVQSDEEELLRESLQAFLRRRRQARATRRKKVRCALEQLGLSRTAFPFSCVFDCSARQREANRFSIDEGQTVPSHETRSETGMESVLVDAFGDAVGLPAYEVIPLQTEQLSTDTLDERIMSTHLHGARLPSVWTNHQDTDNEEGRLWCRLVGSMAGSRHGKSQAEAFMPLREAQAIEVHGGAKIQNDEAVSCASSATAHSAVWKARGRRSDFADTGGSMQRACICRCDAESRWGETCCRRPSSERGLDVPRELRSECPPPLVRHLCFWAACRLLLTHGARTTIHARIAELVSRITEVLLATSVFTRRSQRPAALGDDSANGDTVEQGSRDGFTKACGGASAAATAGSANEMAEAAASIAGEGFVKRSWKMSASHGTCEAGCGLMQPRARDKALCLEPTSNRRLPGGVLLKPATRWAIAGGERLAEAEATVRSPPGVDSAVILQCADWFQTHVGRVASRQGIGSSGCAGERRLGEAVARTQTAALDRFQSRAAWYQPMQHSQRRSLPSTRIYEDSDDEHTLLFPTVTDLGLRKGPSVKAKWQLQQRCQTLRLVLRSLLECSSSAFPMSRRTRYGLAYGHSCGDESNTNSELRTGAAVCLYALLRQMFADVPEDAGSLLRRT